MKKILFTILSAFLLFSCSWNNIISSWTGSLDVINPNADYVYFYGKTCPHCIKVGEYFKKNDIMNKYKIEKREVWENEENSKLFKKTIEDLWIAPENIWVPFVLRKSDKKYFMWEDEIMKLFNPNVVK